MTMQPTTHRILKPRLARVLLYIAAALALAAAPWAVSSVKAADQRSSSGSSRPLAPSNNPAGAGTRGETPGASTGPNALRPGTPAPGTGATPTTPVPDSGTSPGTPAQGTVQGSKGAPGAQGDLPGGAAGSRGQKDTRRGH